MGIRQAVLVSGQTAIGPSRAKNWYSSSSGTMTVEVYFTLGIDTTCSKLVVCIEGSLTGINYLTLASHVLTSTELAGKCCMFHIVSKPVNSVRSNIVTLTKVGGGDVEVTVAALYSNKKGETPVYGVGRRKSNSLWLDLKYIWDNRRDWRNL